MNQTKNKTVLFAGNNAPIIVNPQTHFAAQTPQKGPKVWLMVQCIWIDETGESEPEETRAGRHPGSEACRRGWRPAIPSAADELPSSRAYSRAPATVQHVTSGSAGSARENQNLARFPPKYSQQLKVGMRRKCISRRIALLTDIKEYNFAFLIPFSRWTREKR